MSTRSIIARQVGDGWEGRYHHSDGYPSGVGKALYDAYNGHFKQDISKMLSYLIDEHPAGWSNLVGADLRKKTGFRKDRAMQKTLARRSRGEITWEQYRSIENYPECYCHGERREPADLRTSEEAERCDHYGDIEWLYVISQGDRPVLSIFDLPPGRATLVAQVDLQGPEPDWQNIERRSHQAA